MDTENRKPHPEPLALALDNQDFFAFSPERHC